MRLGDDFAPALNSFPERFLIHAQPDDSVKIGHALGFKPNQPTDIDPLLPSKVDPMNGPKGRESGPRLNA
jgi:hypothetical protein